MDNAGSQVGVSVASAALPDIPHHIHEQHVVVDETIGLETPEQLLTPENSRSETSSNNENASNEEKPTLRRSSTRATRTSLRSSTQLETPETENNDTKDGTPVNGVGDRRQSHLLRTSTSMADIESSLWDAHGVARSNPTDAANTNINHFAPGTPVSESSQEMASGEADTSTLQENHDSQPRRSQRKRVSIYEATPDKTNTTTTTTTPTARSSAKDDKQSTRRRSSRLSISEKVSGTLDRTASVLGKRTRGALTKGKGPDRRSSLRPRDLAPVKKEEAKAEPPAAKKRRVSDSDLPAKKAQQENAKKEEEAQEPAPPPRAPEYKPKRWLLHGLYSGQEPTGPRPVQNKNKTSKRRSRMDAPRKLLPMPLFAGDRLLQNGRDYKLPFDIFSPLPPGQPKPNEWRKTNKNVFVGEAGSIWRANKDMELSQCLCVPETGCDENCQNRYMFYECDKGNCGLGPDCGNRSFEELKHRAKAGGKYNVGVEVIKTADRGYGVRSNRSFEPNQVIVEYTGEILTQSECEKRMRTTYKKNECYYLMYFDQNMIIDATRGSIARFVNHSCAPNCRMEKWTVAGKPRMALFAGDRGIMTGEELTYDYNFDPYSQKNVQQCRCGSSVCRGILGPRPREKEQRSKERESRLDSQKQSKQKSKSSTKSTATKRKIGNELDESTSRLNKKQKVVKSVSKSTASRKKEPATKQKKTTTAKKTTTKETTKKTTTKATKAKTPAKTNAKSKDVKLPKVKSKAKVKATVKTTASSKAKTASTASTKNKAQTTKATTATKATNKLSRPSAETKAKILRTAKGAAARKRTKAQTEATAEPKKRGRKPSIKKQEDGKGAAGTQATAEPKKRGRKPGVKAQDSGKSAAQPAAEPKKRGRKPSIKTQESGKNTQPAAEPKKRGRKPGAKALAAKNAQPTAEPKKRGRKPGVKAALPSAKNTKTTAEPKKRGRKPGVKSLAAKSAQATAEPKKRGRKPGVKYQSSVAKASAKKAD